ncbi:MAG: hypothetical protein ACI80K_001037 [Paracoccaceae bacterium]
MCARRAGVLAGRACCRTGLLAGGAARAWPRAGRTEPFGRRAVARASCGRMGRFWAQRHSGTAARRPKTRPCGRAAHVAAQKRSRARRCATLSAFIPIRPFRLHTRCLGGSANLLSSSPERPPGSRSVICVAACSDGRELFLAELSALVADAVFRRYGDGHVGGSGRCGGAERWQDH